MAGKPGSSTRVSQPAVASAAGRAPAISARPPVLSRGKISALTCSTRKATPPPGRPKAGCAPSGGSAGEAAAWGLGSVIVFLVQLGLAQRPQHFFGHQHHAIGGPLEAFGVELRVFADHHALGQHAAAVEYHFVQAAGAVDEHIGQQHALVDGAERVHPHIGEQHRVADRGARENAPARDHHVDGLAVAAVVVLHELGRRKLALAGPDRPFGVVEVELGGDRGQIEVGGPEGVERADVAPVGLALLPALHARHGKGMRVRQACAHRFGDDVFAEVVRGGGVGHVFVQHAVERAGVEDVDAHAGQRHLFVAGHGGGIRGFFDELDDLAACVDGHDAEGAGLAARHFDAAHGDLRAAGGVVLQHDGVVHLVNMIAGQNHHIFGLARLDDVDVLIDRISRAAVPVFFVHPLLRGEQIDHFVEFGAQKAPAALQVAQQRVRFVLGDHADAADARIDAVGQREVDDAELAAEIHRGLGALVGELLEPRAAPAGQHQGDGAAHQHVRLHLAILHVHRAQGAVLIHGWSPVCFRGEARRQTDCQVITLGVSMPVQWRTRATCSARAMSGASACCACRSWRAGSGSWCSR